MRFSHLFAVAALAASAAPAPLTVTVDISLSNPDHVLVNHQTSALDRYGKAGLRAHGLEHQHALNPDEPVTAYIDDGIYQIMGTENGFEPLTVMAGGYLTLGDPDDTYNTLWKITNNSDGSLNIRLASNNARIGKDARNILYLTGAEEPDLKWKLVSQRDGWVIQEFAGYGTWRVSRADRCYLLPIYLNPPGTQFAILKKK